MLVDANLDLDYFLSSLVVGLDVDLEALDVDFPNYLEQCWTVVSPRVVDVHILLINPVMSKDLLERVFVEVVSFCPIDV